MTRPQVHLSEVAQEYGSGDATGPVRSLLELGMRNKLAQGNGRAPGAHISDAGRCPRQLYFRLTGAPAAPMTLDSWMTLNLGHKAEELYIELLEAAGVTVLTQQTMTLEQDGETITGTLDLLLEIPEGVRAQIAGLDPREVWEVKTKNSRAMGWLLKRGGPEPDDGYVKQLGGYLQGAIEGKVPMPTQARGRLVYTAVGATKGEPLLHAWFVPYQPEEVKADLQRLAQATRGARAGADPGIPEGYEWSKFPCSYCEFRPHCQRTP